MNFNSIQYIFFLALIVFLYYIFPYKYRNILLLVASYFFYMKWNVGFSLLMLFVTGITYLAGRMIENKQNNRKKWIMIVGIALCLAVLLAFKYSGFIFESLNTILSNLGNYNIKSPLDVILPVGISFYTFQAIGYVIDVYRGKEKAEKNFIYYALYILFPTAGSRSN